MTKDELKTLNQELKKVDSEKRPIVRRMLSADISLSDALTVVNAFIPSDIPLKASTSQNKIVFGSEDGNMFVDGEKVENKPVNALERVSDAGEIDLLELSQKIDVALDEYAINHGMDDKNDIRKASQRIWGGISAYIGDTIFKPSKLLKDTHKCNAYDIYKVADAVRLYLRLCDNYNKAVLFDYVAYFLGVSDEWLYQNIEKLTALDIDLYKKRELSLASGIIDSKTNTTGNLACLNKWYSWTTAGATHTEKKETIILYPSLNKPPQTATIEQKQTI